MGINEANAGTVPGIIVDTTISWSERPSTARGGRRSLPVDARLRESADHALEHCGCKDTAVIQADNCAFSDEKRREC
jgi:hypothetical protein